MTTRRLGDGHFVRQDCEHQRSRVSTGTGSLLLLKLPVTA